MEIWLPHGLDLPMVPLCVSNSLCFILHQVEQLQEAQEELKALPVIITTTVIRMEMAVQEEVSLHALRRTTNAARLR